MRSLTIYSILFAFLLALSACGNGETETAQQEEAVDDGVRTIEVIGTDDMKFVVREAAEGLVTGGQAGQFILLEAIEASPGEQIRIRLETRSNLAAAAMAHNLAIIELGTDLEAFVRASIGARDNDYIAPEYEDRVVATTAMLSGGQSDTITFTVPEEPGEYDYVCTFPGHWQAGMVGKLIVQ